MRTKAIILLVVVLMGIGAYLGIQKIRFPYGVPQNPQCLRSSPKSSGDCAMIVRTVVYDPRTNSCKTVTGGGCGIEQVFESVIQCEQACNPGWIPQDPLDIILVKGEVKYKNEYLTFNLGSQDAKYQLNERKGIGYLPRSAFKLQSGDIVSIFRVGEYRFNGAGPDGTEEPSGAYVGLFTPTLEGKYRADKLTYVTNIHTFQGVDNIRDIQWSEQDSIITVEWPQKGNCGPETVPCGSNFKKEFRLENKELFAIQD